VVRAELLQYMRGTIMRIEMCSVIYAFEMILYIGVYWG
jgi:hypothetical protein